MIPIESTSPLLSINSADLPQETKANRHRMTFVDGLRGLAAMLVVLHHSDAVWTGTSLAPFMMALSGHCDLGVEVFFVLSGFSIAYATRGANFSVQWLRVFLVRRLVRLTPAYFVSIVFALVVLGLQNSLGNSDPLPFPTWPALLAHLTYSQELMGYGSVVGVYWTLCLEVQFYIAFAVLMTALSWVRRNIDAHEGMLYSSFLVISLISLSRPFYTSPVYENTLFTSLWFIFASGSLIWWTIDNKFPRLLGWGVSFSLLCFSIVDANEHILAAALTCFFLYICSRSGNLHNWLKPRWIQFLGLISYSLYIVHMPITILMKSAQRRFIGFGFLLSPITLILLYLISIAAAIALYYLIERPSITFSKGLKQANVPGA